MPIKPENWDRYPPNWADIRADILKRADNCCEQCKVPNGATIMRGTGQDADTYMNDDAEVFGALNGALLGRCRMDEYEGRPVRIVLTIAHLDHTPENCAPANLRAWCQRCHLAYDAEHHRRNAAKTRRDRKAMADLFE